MIEEEIKQKVIEAYKKNIPQKHIAKTHGISRNTVHSIIKQYEEDKVKTTPVKVADADLGQQIASVVDNQITNAQENLLACIDAILEQLDENNPLKQWTFNKLLGSGLIPADYLTIDGFDLNTSLNWCRYIAGTGLSQQDIVKVHNFIYDVECKKWMPTQFVNFMTEFYVLIHNSDIKLTDLPKFNEALAKIRNKMSVLWFIEMVLEKKNLLECLDQGIQQLSQQVNQEILRLQDMKNKLNNEILSLEDKCKQKEKYLAWLQMAEIKSTEELQALRKRKEEVMTETKEKEQKADDMVNAKLTEVSALEDQRKKGEENLTKFVKLGGGVTEDLAEDINLKKKYLSQLKELIKINEEKLKIVKRDLFNRSINASTF